MPSILDLLKKDGDVVEITYVAHDRVGHHTPRPAPTPEGVDYASHNPGTHNLYSHAVGRKKI